MSNRKAVLKAADIYKRRGFFTPTETAAAVGVLAAQGLWSKAQIVALSGATSTFVKKNVEKTDHTGGKFNPDSLDLILEMFDLMQAGEKNPKLTAAIVDAGTSVRMLSRLTGRPEPSIKYEIGKANE